MAQVIEPLVWGVVETMPAALPILTVCQSTHTTAMQKLDAATEAGVTVLIGGSCKVLCLSDVTQMHSCAAQSTCVLLPS